MTGETVLILANAEWDWANRVNCHHLATRLARENQVLFVETIGGRTPAPREFRKVTRRLRRIAGGIRRINDHLTVLSPFVVPFYASEAVRRLNTALLAWQIRRAVPQASEPILWIFLPSLVGLVGRLSEKLVIYYCVDEHAANPNVPAAQVMQREQQLMTAADVVFTTASTLYESKRPYNQNTFYLPNPADTEHFGRALDPALAIAPDLKNIRHPVAGYIGNVTAYKVDFNLLKEVASAKPDWSFVLIGPVGRGDPSTRTELLEGLRNVLWLGERPFSDLPQYLKGFDVCLIPFKQNPSTRGTLPMKFFEYLAAGKPVVATDLPALVEFRSLFYPARDAKEFVNALDMALREDAGCSAQRLEVARKYSWDARMTELDKILTGVPRRDRTGQSTVHFSAQGALKRLMDVAGAALGLIVLSPLLLAIAIAIRLADGSPILYEWNVVGQNGKRFTGFKFRTMIRNADSLKRELEAKNEMSGPVFKLRDDPRVTPLGRVLRKYSLDELPQLWSVLKGDMSLVGPRPPLVYEYEKFSQHQKRKLSVRPGMTSLWQVRGKPSDFNEWLRLDLEYIEDWSLWLDVKILLKTAMIVVTGKNY